MATIATRVEFAFGADLTANPATWIWTDVSRFAVGSSVTVTPGRPDEAGTTTPTRCVFRLRNSPLPGGPAVDSGRFSPRFPTSPHYPNVRRQTPVRVSLNPGGLGWFQRFQGYVDQWVPQWLSSNTDYAEVEVTASGSLRRLGQGSAPLRSAMVRALTDPTLPVSDVAAWYLPLEDSQFTTQVYLPLPPNDPYPVRITNPVSFGAVQGAPGSNLMPRFAHFADFLRISIPTTTFTNRWRFQYAFQIFPFQNPATDFITPLLWYTGQTDSDAWSVGFAPVAGGGIEFIPPYGGVLTDTFVAVDDGLWHEIRVEAIQSGPNINLTLRLDGALIHSQTINAVTLPPINDVFISAGGATASVLSQFSMGHAAIWNTAVSTLDTVAALNGYPGETAVARLTRLCKEEGVPLALTGTSDTAMGPQGVSTFVSLLRECEAADSGILYDGAGPGLSYLARSSRENLAVSLALDCLRQQVKLPFTPTEDDQRVRNDWTVTRPGGTFAHFTDPVHIAANGLYDTSAAVNVQADSMLLDQAAWRVHLGTVEEMRVPGLSLQLIDRPELWTPWLATTLGERVTAQNLPPQYPPGILDMILEGYTETWNAASWKVDLNTSPFAPWRIFLIAAETGDNGEFVGHLDTDDSALNAAITSTATSFAVKTNSGPLWTTVADDFPFDINIDGERITVTNITGAASPQTFTVTRSVNGVVKAHLINAAVSLWAPLVLGL